MTAISSSLAIVALCALGLGGCVSLQGSSSSAAPAKLVSINAPLMRDPQVEQAILQQVQEYWAKDGTDDALYVRLMANHWLDVTNSRRQWMPFQVVTKIRSSGKCMLHSFQATRHMTPKPVKDGPGTWKNVDEAGPPIINDNSKHEFIGETSCDAPVDAVAP